MQITLTPEQQAWLKAEIAAGKFASVEDAVEIALTSLQAEDADDYAWAKPLVDAASAAIDRGEFMTLEEHRARMKKRLDALSEL